MKKRNSMIVLAILIAVLVLGVGYAAVSAVSLNLTGSAKVKDIALDVVFTGETDVDTSGADEADCVATSDTNGLTGTITVTDLKTVGEKVSAIYTVKNREISLSASVLKKTITNSKSDFFKVTTSVDSTPAVIAKGATTTVTVTVELIKVPILEADSTTTIGVELEATPVNPT
jgi:hypothetical protein